MSLSTTKITRILSGLKELVFHTSSGLRTLTFVIMIHGASRMACVHGRNPSPYQKLLEEKLQELPPLFSYSKLLSQQTARRDSHHCGPVFWVEDKCLWTVRL